MMPEKEYIEREAMLKYIDENIFRMKQNKEDKHPIAIETIRNFIATFDTSDVAPVKRGEWIKATKPYPYYDYKCSVCGCEEYRQIDSKGKVKIMNFCPNCGADMSNT